MRHKNRKKNLCVSHPRATVSFPQSSFQSRNNSLVSKMCCSSLLKSKSNDAVKKISRLDFDVQNNDDHYSKKSSWLMRLFPMIWVLATLCFYPLPNQYFETELSLGNCTLENRADFVKLALTDVLITTSLITASPIIILLIADLVKAHKKSSTLIREAMSMFLGFFISLSVFLGDYEDSRISIGHATVLAFVILVSLLVVRLHIGRYFEKVTGTVGFWISVDFFHNLVCGLAICANTLEHGFTREILIMMSLIYQKLPLEMLCSIKFYECGCSKTKVFSDKR